MATVPDVPVFDWYPSRLLQEHITPPADAYAVVILNQPLKSLSTISRIWKQASFRVAADGGANRLFDAKTRDQGFDNLDVVIGDLDSLRDDARAYFTTDGRSAEIIHNPDQYSTDFMKAVWLIHERHPGLSVVAIGGLGGRVDQGLSQLHHLYMFQDDGSSSSDGGSGQMRHIFLLSSESLTFLLPRGHHHIHVREPATSSSPYVFDKYVGILPMQGPSIISTKGLEWDVTDWPTQFGGQISTSNHVLPETQVVHVQTDRPVVFTIALKEA